MDKEETKPLNRIKVVLAEKGKPNKFLLLHGKLLNLHQNLI